MPRRNTKFRHYSSDDDTLQVYGVYSKNNAWKTWGNSEQGQSSEALLGRRYQSSDNECRFRNMLISVIAREDNPELLLELWSAPFSAIKVSFSFLISISALYFSLFN